MLQSFLLLLFLGPASVFQSAVPATTRSGVIVGKKRTNDENYIQLE